MKLSALLKSFTTVEYYVVVFDLCSSSTILEKLQEQDQIKVWRTLWEDIFRYLNKISSGGGKCIVYKFVGDGFILLYRPQYKKSLLSFCDDLKTYINEKIKDIIENYIGAFPNRVGITIGIEKGTLIRMRLYGNVEYMGKAINVASRLQSLLKLPEHSNKMLITLAVKDDIHDQLGNKAHKFEEKILHNLYGNKSITCCEIDMDTVHIDNKNS